MNKELNIGYHSISENYGYYIDKVPQHILNELKIEIDKIQNDFSSGEKLNDKLVGEIQHEYVLPIGKKVDEYIKNIADKFGSKCDFYKHKKIPLVSDQQLWVNFQKKYEYNPLHTHLGIFSYVIWYKVPYYLADEQKYNYKNTWSYNGDFSFTYIGIDRGNNLSIKQKYMGIDKNAEGYIVFFPANLHHSVNPFYSSDEYRITVAGNIVAASPILNNIPTEEIIDVGE